MLWLYIMLGIVAFIFLVLLIPVGVEAEYRDDFRLRLLIGFVPIILYPTKTKKQKKKKKTKKKQTEKKSDKKPEKEKKPSIIKEKGLSWLLSVVKRVAELAAGVLKDFFRHLKIKKLMLSVSVAGEDAADTAVKYGTCCSVIYPSVSAIVRAARCKKYGVDVAPDFNEGAKTEIFLDCRVSTLPLRLVGLVLKNGFKALKLLMDLRNE